MPQATENVPFVSFVSRWSVKKTGESSRVVQLGEKNRENRPGWYRKAETRMKTSRSSPLGLYVIGIAALFLAGFLMLVIFGAQTYRNTVSVQNDNNETRATLSYISATVRAYDNAGAVEIKQEQLADGSETQVLALADGNTGYAVRIYTSGGNLMEEYARTDAALTPSASNIIGATQTFEAEKEGSILRVRTDEGSVFLHLRAE